MRTQGRTFRAVLRSIEHASEHDKAFVMFVTNSSSHRDFALRMCADILMNSIPDFVLIRSSHKTIHFMNDSRIFFCLDNYIEEHKFRGIAVTKLEEDFEYLPNRLYRETRPYLQAIIHKFEKQRKK